MLEIVESNLFFLFFVNIPAAADFHRTRQPSSRRCCRLQRWISSRPSGRQRFFPALPPHPFLSLRPQWGQFFISPPPDDRQKNRHQLGCRLTTRQKNLSFAVGYWMTPFCCQWSRVRIPFKLQRCLCKGRRKKSSHWHFCSMLKINVWAIATPRTSCNGVNTIALLHQSSS